MRALDRVRRYTVAIVAIAAVGCSGDQPDEAAPEGTVEVTSTTAAAQAGSVTTIAPTPTTEAIADRQVDVAVRAGETTAQIALDVETDTTPSEPFGRFASCSGWRSTVGTYTVQISEPSAAVNSVSLATFDPVTGGGIYAAAARLATSAGAALDVVGTLEIDPSLQAGTFTSAPDELDQAEIEFECTGGALRPTVQADDGEPFVEVFALLRRGESERVVSLTASGHDADLRCSAGSVAAVGDDRIGSLTSFEVGSGEVVTAFAIGGADVALDHSTVVAGADPTSGTFSAVALDGTAIEGAYRCR